MRFIYEITDNNEVKIYDTVESDTPELPVIWQPFYPNGEKFQTREAAESWAIAHVEHTLDHAKPRPEVYPGQPLEDRLPE